MSWTDDKTKAFFEARGYEMVYVEVKLGKLTRDFLGCDWLGFPEKAVGNRMILVQNTSSSNHSARRRKLLERTDIDRNLEYFDICVISWKDKHSEVEDGRLEWI